jgi:hypothetical protein
VTTDSQATRAELLHLAGAYLDALAVRDLSAAPLASAVRYTENGQVLPLGSGAWASEGGEAGYRLLFADPAQQQVGAFAVVKENGVRGVMAVRLGVRAGRIAEVEAIVARLGARIFEPEALSEPRRELVEAVAPGERSSREELVAIAETYFDALEQCGSGTELTLPPVAAGCLRVENGHTTTGHLTLDELVASGQTALAEGFEAVRRLRIADQLVGGCFRHITRVRDRRYPVVDEEQGLVLGIVLFDQPGTRRHFELPGLGTFELPAEARLPTSPLIAELFKIAGGEIRAIDVVLNWFPLGMPSGWS